MFLGGGWCGGIWRVLKVFRCFLGVILERFEGFEKFWRNFTQSWECSKWSFESGSTKADAARPFRGMSKRTDALSVVFSLKDAR